MPSGTVPLGDIFCSNSPGLFKKSANEKRFSTPIIESRHRFDLGLFSPNAFAQGRPLLPIPPRDPVCRDSSPTGRREFAADIERRPAAIVIDEHARSFDGTIQPSADPRPMFAIPFCDMIDPPCVGVSKITARVKCGVISLVENSQSANRSIHTTAQRPPRFTIPLGNMLSLLSSGFKKPATDVKGKRPAICPGTGEMVARILVTNWRLVASSLMAEAV